MKIKENKGISLLVLTIVLGLLVVLGGGVIAYLLNNPVTVSQNVSENNVALNNNKNEVYENTNQVADNNEKEEIENEDKIIKKEQLDKYGDIILEAAYVNEEEYMLVYTRKDKNNKVIWTYKTGTEKPAEHSHIGTSKITEDRIYIEDHGTITVLNINTGKTLWQWKYEDADVVVRTADVNYVDEQKNTYITYGKTLTILDENGKVKSTTTYDNLKLTDSHCGFTYINKTEGIVWGNDEFVIVNLNDYSKKITGTYESTWSDENQTVKITHLNVMNDDSYDQGMLLSGYEEGNETWAYRTDIEEVGQYDEFGIFEITSDRIYFNEEGNVVVLDKNNGQVIWEYLKSNEDMLINSANLDEEQNLHILYRNGNEHILDKDGKVKEIIEHVLDGGF